MSAAEPKHNLTLIVCGGRDYADRAQVFKVLDRIHDERTIEMIIQGGAEGADSLAEDWATERGVACTAVPAQWAKHGRAAGPIRNGEMLKLKPDGVVAFPGGRGTADMCRQAEAAGLIVMRA